MIVTCIACTHEHESQIVVPGGDLLICAGDISFYGDPVPIGLFCQWLERQPYKKKVFIAGNHDFLFQEDPALAKDIYSAYDVTYLQDSSIEFEGKKIYGSPWVPRFFDWAFQTDDWSARDHWKKVPKGTDILITHGPPAGVLDLTKGERVGCPHLMNAVMRVNPTLHVFGHVHESWGTRTIGKTTFINASLCDRKNRFAGEPITVEI